MKISEKFFLIFLKHIILKSLQFNTLVKSTHTAFDLLVIIN